MKKYLTIALAMPLLFACSSEDLTEKEVIGNNQFAGIETVDATFSMDEESVTRMATQWTLEEGDQYGFAWLTDKYDALSDAKKKVSITGDAFQNHPLTQKGSKFVPETSIYVGKYFLYRPYDKNVVSPDKIHFSLAEQKLANDASEKHNSAPYKALAATAILIGDKWTDVDPAGHTVDETKWDLPGIGKQYDLYAALFSNRTALDLTYKNNNPKFASETTISGATDIDFKIAKDEEVGAVDISKITVDLQRTGSISATTFTYGPDALGKEPVKVASVLDEKHDGKFWADKSNVEASYGFDFTDGAITLENEDKSKINTGTEGSKGWFWFNSLPVTAGDAALTDKVVTTYETTFGTVTIDDKDGDDTEVTLQNVAYAREIPTGKTAKEWIKFGDSSTEDETLDTDKKIWDIDATKHNTFVNQYGDHVGKYAITVDFSKCVMNGMHITDDNHLQKALRYYIASGKNEAVTLNLDQKSASDNTFKLSKISIALLQTINATTKKVTVKACTSHGTPKIIITQDGQTGDLANAKEVPALNKVFAVATDVFLSKDCQWTWDGGSDAKTALTVDDKVKSITNEGTLTVNATNVQLSVTTTTLANAAGATMKITKVTTVKNALTNLGTIEVGDPTNTTAELRAYAVAIDNDATGLEAGKYGVINNYGVVGVTEGTTPAGEFNNYGFIDMKDANAITLLSTNELTSNFDDAFNASTNKMGTVQLPNNNPTAIVSVNNAAANGFIKYTWPTDQTTYVTPAGNVKYNTIVVSANIEFTEIENEIKYVVFNGLRTQVVNTGGYLKQLKGVIVNANKSIIIEKGNKLVPLDGTFLGTGATVYNGGTFTPNAKLSGTTAYNYFGEWSTDQIVKY